MRLSTVVGPPLHSGILCPQWKSIWRMSVSWQQGHIAWPMAGPNWESHTFLRITLDMDALCFASFEWVNFVLRLTFFVLSMVSADKVEGLASLPLLGDAVCAFFSVLTAILLEQRPIFECKHFNVHVISIKKMFLWLCKFQKMQSLPTRKNRNIPSRIWRLGNAWRPLSFGFKFGIPRPTWLAKTLSMDFMIRVFANTNTNWVTRSTISKHFRALSDFRRNFKNRMAQSTKSFLPTDDF